MRILLLVTGHLLLAACTEPVQVDAPAPSGVAAGQCRTLVDALPDRVADQDARRVEPEDALAGAWGDPAIVLRCGVPAPAGLRPDSACFVVNGVGWFAEEDGRPVDGTQPVNGELVFTTIGRTAYVEVTVPPDYQPAADALVDLSAAVQAIPEERPCV